MSLLTSDNDPCPIGKPGETWGAYWKRRERQEAASIVAEHGRHEIDREEVIYSMACGKCGGSVSTDGDWFWHDVPGIEPEEGESHA